MAQQPHHRPATPAPNFHIISVKELSNGGQKPFVGLENTNRSQITPRSKLLAILNFTTTTYQASTQLLRSVLSVTCGNVCQR